MNTIATQNTVEMFCMGIALILGIVWLPVSVSRFTQTRKLDSSDAVVRDRVFGAYVGLVATACGLGGVVKHLLTVL
jgi:hypothetical protein